MQLAEPFNLFLLLSGVIGAARAGVSPRQTPLSSYVFRRLLPCHFHLMDSRMEISLGREHFTQRLVRPRIIRFEFDGLVCQPECFVKLFFLDDCFREVKAGGYLRWRDLQFALHFSNTLFGPFIHQKSAIKRMRSRLVREAFYDAGK